MYLLLLLVLLASEANSELIFQFDGQEWTEDTIAGATFSPNALFDGFTAPLVYINNSECGSVVDSSVISNNIVMYDREGKED